MNEYVTKEEFQELVDRFNALIDELSKCNLKKDVELDELIYSNMEFEEFVETEEQDENNESEENVEL